MQHIRKILALVLLLIFLGSTGVMIHQQLQKQESSQSVQAAEKIAAITGTAEVPPLSQPSQKQASPLSEVLLAPTYTAPDTLQAVNQALTEVPQLIAQSLDITSWLPVVDDANTDSLLCIDIDALQEVNPDVLGWFLIPGTNISYPLLQGEDNHYYLDYTWNNRKSFVGSIFMECTSAPALSDFNTIIYGHNLGDTHMFSTLTKYRSQNYWSEHPYAYIVNESGAYRYQIFAAYQAGTDAETFRLRFLGPDPKQAFLEDALASSVIETGITPTASDRILTLSTCVRGDPSSRWIVQARLEGQLNPS